MPIPQIELAPGLMVSRVLTGLWQVADIERTHTLDTEQAADALIEYGDAGFSGFDMADHYGSAELIAGRARQKLLGRDGSLNARFFTKWCPTPEQWRPQDVRAGIQERLDRLATDRIDLLQLHWWSFEHPGWIDVMDSLMVLKQEGLIGAVGVTNLDADHLHVLTREGYEIATNQVSFSVLDRRAAGDLSAVCKEGNVKLLAYGTLAGGFLSEKWLDQPEPADIPDWSGMKYRRFIEQAGGWAVFQTLLKALHVIAKRHGVSIANVATRWVLQHDTVGCTIIGARLGEREHRDDTAKLFSFELESEDIAELDTVFLQMRAIPGDCGQEYRRPPFLTASGDLSHHLDSLPSFYQPARSGPNRWKVSSGSVWEEVCGFSRALRQDRHIMVSGTTATHTGDRAICKGDVRGQTVYALDKIAAAIRSLGGSLDDVIRTRIYMKDARRWEEASRVHGRFFAGIEPTNTLIEISDLVGDYDIEIEADALLPDDALPPGLAPER